MSNKKPTIGVAFITHCAKHHLPNCLPPVINSPLHPKVLVVNSSSHDGTVELAEELGAETLVIPRNEFNHGTTRELARKALGTDIVVMMTPDAYAKDDHLLGNLVKPIINGEASIAYARQIPHKKAGFFESFARKFNYPRKSQIRELADTSVYGIYTFFCSDSCAAYSSKALDQIGGFQRVLIGEDTVAVAKLLQLGHKIAYVAEAVVRHSHTYTLWQEFQRHFDTGLARKEYGHLFIDGGRDEKRGIAYTKTLLLEVLEKKPFLLPYAILQTLVKVVAYRIGRWSHPLPKQWKKTFSGQDYFWN